MLINEDKLAWTTRDTLVTASSLIRESKDDTYSARKKKKKTAFSPLHYQNKKNIVRSTKAITIQGVVKPILGLRLIRKPKS